MVDACLGKGKQDRRFLSEGLFVKPYSWGLSQANILVESIEPQQNENTNIPSEPVFEPEIPSILIRIN